ncbi:MAG: hypothetical protein OSA97_14715 [Nevskia sp.]|nr:hypothetical protein [Nevskia sp.]
MRALIALCLLLPPLALADAAPDPLQPLAFLAGHCWKGSFPGQAQTDEHCFEWLYDGHFLRDRHVVRGPGHPDYLGETTYYWDADARRIQYLYIESQGGTSKGGVEAAADGLSFPPARYVDNGREQVYRSRWQRSGDDAYEAVNEFRSKDGGWTQAWRVRMQRQPDTAPQQADRAASHE